MRAWASAAIPKTTGAGDLKQVVLGIVLDDADQADRLFLMPGNTADGDVVAAGSRGCASASGSKRPASSPTAA